MLTLRDIDIEEINLMPWGQRYGHIIKNGEAVNIPLANTATCPNCTRFSILCHGQISGHPVTGKHAAEEWFEQVMGFEPARNMFSADDKVGVVTLQCPRCNSLFGYAISLDVIQAYMSENPTWRAILMAAEHAARAEADQLRLRKDVIKRLRQAATAIGFQNSQLTDIEFQEEFAKNQESYEKDFHFGMLTDNSKASVSQVAA